MINQIIDFSIKNKFITGLFTIAIIGLGIWSIQKIPIDATPDITNNQVQVITQAPNLGTEEIEQFITYPVELAMSNLPDIKEIRSISRFGLSVVTIVFKDNMGTYLPRQLVSEKLPEIQEQIPEGFGKPEMGPISTGLGEIYQYTLEVEKGYENKFNATKLRTLQDWIVRRQMAMVPGVVEVNAFGGNKKQYEISINPAKLTAMDITISEVFEALKNNNENTGGAYIVKNHQANFIRGEGLIKNIDDINNIVIKNINNIPVKIKDIATVVIGNAVRYGAFTKDGKGEAVGGMILMLKGANSNEVIKNVKKRIVQIQKSLPKGVKIKPFLDRSKLIVKTTNTVSKNLLEGGLIVIFVLIILLGNWRGGLIVASTIPLSLLFAFILMNIFDVWANLMSLGAIDFGIIVDGAVIIVESTVFLLSSKLSNSVALNQKSKDELTATASKKMMNSAFFGQLIILIVFIPILALQGVEGKMFKPMALTFMFAMIGAMILCLTYVPMISSLFLKAHNNQKQTWGDKFVHWVEKKYELLLNKTLKIGTLIVSISTLLLAISIFIFSKMGGEFIPQLDEGDIAFHVILKPGSSLNETIKSTTKVERIIKATFPEVETIVSRIGVADVPTDPMPMDIADVFVILKPNKDWTSANSKVELVEKMKEAISIVPGINFEFTQPIEMRFNELLTGVREDVAIKLFGENLEILAQKAEEIGKLINKVKGVADMKVESTTGQPQISIQYNRNRLAQYGVQINQLNHLIQTTFAGGNAGVIFEGEKRFDLVVRFAKSFRKDISDIQNLIVQLPSGTKIPLRELANISYKPGPMQISRDNTNRRTYVGINIRNRDVKSVITDIQKILDDKLKLPPGYYIQYGGAFENLKRAENRLKTVVPIALLLIFILIFFALKSLPQTLMIYVAIPLATIGGIFALWLREMPFSISAGVGFIVLFGVAVLNGLVMISGLNELKEQGITDLKNRILEGTKRRIRPIMLTAFTDVLGFLPMAISSSAGAEVQRPLATVVIGGLLTSTLLTLFVLPILYHWVEQGKFKFKMKNTKLTTAFIILIFLGISNTVNAQQNLPKISLKEALILAQKNYPTLQQKQWEVKKQKALKFTAYDFGETQIYTGGEEVGSNNILYTPVGISQSGIDIFGINSKRKLQNKNTEIAEKTFELSKLNIQQKVKKAWAKAQIAKKKALLFKELDSIYTKFHKALKLYYQTEEISKLEFLAGQNQVLNIKNQKEQALSNYQIALQSFNLFLVSPTTYDIDENEEIPLLINLEKNIDNNLQNTLNKKILEQQKAMLSVAKSNRIPKFNIEGSWQKQNGKKNLFSYQIGISIPLLSGESLKKVKEAKFNKEIAESVAFEQKKELKTAYEKAKINFKKWQKTWTFYKNDILPILSEQRKGALFAYKERAIDYASFTQIMKEVIDSELKAQQAFFQYLNSSFTLQYLTNNNH